MENQLKYSLIDLNMSVNQIRGSWVQLAKKYNINYHEMLVLYHVYYNGRCTQKQICEDYLLPKQTVNNIVTALKTEGRIELQAAVGNKKEKVLVLTPAGEDYISTLVASMKSVEEIMQEKIGAENLQLLTDLLAEYGDIIKEVIAAD
ncbi:MAG: winged helix-turn-helix transcriptional regulator [Oscillospiraceae bacterium]|nr:winged helix-turn-helix transcriptional regulator [Oscillospiraceae bacterium]